MIPNSRAVAFFTTILLTVMLFTEPDAAAINRVKASKPITPWPLFSRNFRCNQLFEKPIFDKNQALWHLTNPETPDHQLRSILYNYGDLVRVTPEELSVLCKMQSRVSAVMPAGPPQRNFDGLPGYELIFKQVTVEKDVKFYVGLGPSLNISQKDYRIRDPEIIQVLSRDLFHEDETSRNGDEEIVIRGAFGFPLLADGYEPLTQILNPPEPSALRTMQGRQRDLALNDFFFPRRQFPDYFQALGYQTFTLNERNGLMVRLPTAKSLNKKILQLPTEFRVIQFEEINLAMTRDGDYSDDLLLTMALTVAKSLMDGKLPLNSFREGTHNFLKYPLGALVLPNWFYQRLALVYRFLVAARDESANPQDRTETEEKLIFLARLTLQHIEQMTNFVEQVASGSLRRNGRAELHLGLPLLLQKYNTAEFTAMPVSEILRHIDYYEREFFNANFGTGFLAARATPGWRVSYREPAFQELQQQLLQRAQSLLANLSANLGSTRHD